MSLEESNTMSQKIPSQDSPYDSDASDGTIEWDLDLLKKAITDSADEYERLLDQAGQHELPSGAAEAMWEMERQMWSQRQRKEGLDESSF